MSKPRSQRPAEPSAHAALDALPHAVALLDATGKIEFANAAWHAAAAEGLLPNDGSFVDRFAEDGNATDRRFVASVIDAVEGVLGGKRTAKAAQYRARIAHKSLWFDVTIKRRSDADGALVLFEDRSLARKDYTEVVEANRILRDVLDHLPRRAFWKDIEGTIIGANTSFFADYGDAPLVGKPIDEVPWPQSLADFFHASDARVVATREPHEGLVELPSAAGAPARWLHAANAPLKRGDGSVIGTIGSYVDVTEEHTLREAVRESEERLRLTLDAAEIGTFDSDLINGRTTFDERCERMLLHEPAELGSDLAKWSALIHPEDQAEGAQALQAHIENRADSYSYEKRMLAKDRSWHWIRESGRILARAADGTPARLVGIMIDVTREKLARARAEEMASRLHLATQAARIGIWEYDYKQRVMTWDARLFEIYGQSQHDFDPAQWTACVHPDDFERVKSAIFNLDMGRDTLDETYRIVKPDGTVAHVRSQGALERAASGRTLRAVGTTLDVTATATAAEAVLLGKQQLEAFVENAPASVAMFDKEMRYIVCSRRWIIEGHTGQIDLIGKRHHDLFPETETMWRAIMARCNSGETLKEGGQRSKRADGTIGWINWEARPWRDHRGEIGGTIFAFEDITKEMEVRAQLEIANQRLSDFVATASDWLWESNSRGMITYISGRFFEASGFSSDEIVGKPMAMFAPSETNQTRLEELKRAEAQEDFRDVFSQIPLKDGSIMYIRSSGKAQLDATGKFKGYAGTSTDVSAYVRQANAAKHAQQLQSVGTLASGVAHEFNNILAIIRGYADLAKLALERGETSPDDINQVIEAAARGSALTKDLLALGRGASDVETTFDVADLVTEQRLFLRPLTGPQFELTVERAPGAALMRASRDNVAQGIMNLVLNARDASPRGGRIELAVEVVEAVHVFSRFKSPPITGRFVCVRVTDHGIGMDDAVLRRIFEPFFTTKDIGVGTGLGLHFVYQLINETNGYLDVTSKPGTGTTFQLYFPEAEPVADAPLAEPGQRLRYTGMTALVVDDELALTGIYKGMLEALGFTVVASSDPEAALEIVDNHVGDLDLIVSDVLMPKMDGPHFAELATALHPEARVLFVTGQPTRGPQQTTKLPAAAAVLRKPCTSDDLAAMLAKLFQGAKRRTA